MASTYSPYDAVSQIYKLKGQWETANNAGDATAKSSAAQKAQEYYEQLKANGYGDVAEQLSKSNYTQAKAINDKWAKTGKTSTRNYLYSLGQSQGMSKSDVDNLISWDNQSGEVSFGGKKIGTPDSIVDGVSYWSDTSVLDNAFNDYVSRSGTYRDKPLAVNQENENLFAKYNQTYDDITKTNPLKTDVAKAILGKYDLAGLQARDNAVANGSATNGGNIDSYSAANAMRQQSALINQGQTAVLDAHQQKIDNIRGLLSDMGVNIDRVFNQDETAKNNEVARLSEEANVTGYVPNEWTIKNDDIYSQFLNEDGTFKKEQEGVDIQALINQAKASGDTETAKKLAVVRTRKILGNYGKFGQYSNIGDISSMTPQQTEAGRQFDVNNDTVLESLRTESADNRYKIDVDAQTKQYQSTTNNNSGSSSKPSLTAAQARDALKSGEVNQSTIDAYNYHYKTNYTVSNPPKWDEKGNLIKTILSDAEVETWVNALNKQIGEKYPGKTAINKTGDNSYTKGDADADWIIIRVLESDSLTPEQKQYLLIDKFGITPDQINTAMKDPHYRK